MKTYLLNRKDPGLQAFLDAACLQLCGKKISRARRSIGSCLLIDFGNITSYRETDRSRRFGEWHMLIEMSDWHIRKGQRLLLDNDKRPAVIDDKLAALLVGRTIGNVSNKPRGDLKFDLDDNVNFSIKKRYRKKYNNNWVLFYKNYWSLSNATEDDLYEINFYPECD